MTAAPSRPLYKPAVLARVRRAKCWRLTAWHEAGHAVAGVLVGRAVVRVELCPVARTGCLGRCVYRVRKGGPDPSTWTNRRVEREAVCTLAGGEAERLLVGRNSAVGRHADDGNVADLALSRLGGDEAGVAGFSERMSDLTRSLLVANRPAVEMVAESLLLSDALMLTGRQVRELVEVATRRPG